MAECPDSIEELEALEKLIPLCRKEILKQVEARKEAGTATSDRDAARQLAEETGRTEEGIRTAVKRARKVGSVNPRQPAKDAKSKKVKPRASQPAIDEGEYSLANRYKLVSEGPEKIYWHGPDLIGLSRRIDRGKCTIQGEILVLGHGRSHFSMIGGHKAFNEDLETLPKWTQTKYFCMRSDLKLCK